MMRCFVCVVLLVASVMASPAHAAMSAVNPALLQNLDTRPKKVVLLAPDTCKPADKRVDTGEAAPRLRHYLALNRAAADRTYIEYYISLMDSAALADNNLPKAE